MFLMLLKDSTPEQEASKFEIYTILIYGGGVFDLHLDKTPGKVPIFYIRYKLISNNYFCKI